MRAYDLIELAGRNLREAGLRNSLTTLGIGVGVASLVAMLSLGIGLQKLVNRNLGRSGLFDTIVVTSRQDARAPRFTGADASLSALAAREWRKLALVRQLSLTKMTLEIFRRRLRAHFQRSVLFNDRFVAAAPDNHVRVGSYKRILRYSFATLDRLQEKCVTR